MTTTEANGIMNWPQLHRRVNPYVTVGTSLAGVTDAEQALKLGGLDYKIELNELTSVHLGIDGVTTVPVKRHFAVNRVNPDGGVRNLSVVGTKYVPRQNIDTAVPLQHIVDSMDGIFTAVGETHNGARTFVQMELPNNATMIGGRDAVRWSLVALNSHDGSGQFRIIPTAARIECENQLPGLRKSEIGISFRHTKASGEQVDMTALRKALGLSVQHIENFTTLGNKLITEPMTSAEFAEFVKRVVPDKKDKSGVLLKTIIPARQAMTTLFNGSDTMTEIRGTRWAAYNAVTEFDQWVKTYTARTNRAERIVTGRSDDVARRALALLV